VDAGPEQDEPRANQSAVFDGIASLVSGVFVGGTACAAAAWAIIHANPSLAEKILDLNQSVFKSLGWTWAAANPQTMLGWQIMGAGFVAGAGLGYFLWRDLRSS
jgi:hypothetical protein